MSIHRPWSISPRSAARVAVLFLVLTGLFGMHGLDSHETGGMGSMPQIPMIDMSGMAGALEMADVGQVPEAAWGVVVAGVEGAAAAGLRVLPLPSGDMSMGLMICVAILAGALLALLRLLLGQRSTSLLWSRPRQQAAQSHTGRRPAPPSLTALSIQRC